MGMRLAVDTHHLLLEQAGTKRVTVNLLDQLKAMPEVDLIELKPAYPMKRGKGAAGKAFGHLIRFFWVHIHLPLLCALRKADVLLSPEFNTPMFTGCNRVVIAHDAHTRAQRKYTSKVWFYAYYVPLIEAAIRRADLVFTVSEFAKKQVVELMRVNEEKVQVAYNGVDETFLQPADAGAAAAALAAFGLCPQSYILFVGTFETRKNIERLIEAFSQVRKRHAASADELKLAIIGNPASGKYSDRSKQIMDLIAAHGLSEAVVLCGFIPDEELPHFYRNASLLAFPSLQEGFGLPIIEGFACEVPVLTSNLCSMPEIAGDAAKLVDPYSVEDIALGLEEILFDKVLQSSLVSAGKMRAASFTWKNFARKITASIAKLK